MPPAQPTIVGLGELLWDLLPTGAQLGGAPANFACHASQLGANAAVVSCVGGDDLGVRALDLLAEHDVDVRDVGRNDYPTGTVEVAVDGQGQPSYDIIQDVAWDHLTWSPALAELAASTAAVCFGSLAQRSEKTRKTIYRFLSMMRADALIILDVNLRPPFYNDDLLLRSLRSCHVLKLNDQELPILASLCDCAGTEIEILQQLSESFSFQCIALTRGSSGSILLRGAEVDRQPAADVKEVVDTVGAGDAFTAALVLGLLTNQDLSTINATANQIAGAVCEQAGATPKLPAQFANFF